MKAPNASVLRNALRAVAAVVALAPFAAGAQFVNHLQPLAFLAGHCWKGEVPDAAQSDEHCFQWLYGDKALRDVHTVRAPGRPDYVGETTYYWDPTARSIRYLYIENQGGIMRGSVEPAPGVLVFPAAQYFVGGNEMTLRVKWTVLDANSYEAWSEAKDKDAWSTMFKVTMKKVS